MTSVGIETATTAVDGSRWELLRALGSLTVLSPPANDPLVAALALPAWTRAAHTQTFVLELPPFESIHLGPEGKLGGEGADRVAGMWRTLGLVPPADADHLGALLALYAELGEASETSRTPTTRRRLRHTRTALLWEHLWSWVPGYLVAVSGDGGPSRAWAKLTGAVLEREATTSDPARHLPLGLRMAPDPLQATATLEALLDAVTTPVSSGFILTHRDLVSAARTMGLGLRRGERRFALRAMLEQDAPSTLSWLGDHARTWTSHHRLRPPVVADPGVWWTARAAHSASVLVCLASREADGVTAAPGSREH